MPNDGGEGIRLLLGYRPPYAWDALLAFVEGRAIPGVESVEDGRYMRSVTLQAGSELLRGWIGVQHLPEKNAIAVSVAPPLLPALPKLLAKVRALFDVDCNPLEIAGRLAALNELAPISYEPGTRLPGCFDPFEMSVRAVLGQQVTVKAARTLAARFAAAFGEEIATPFKGLTHTFPTYAVVAALEPPIEDRLGPLGITGARARSILGLARALSEGSLTLAPYADPQEEMRALLGLPGFGPWTVEYIAMRALGWPDAFPHTDYGVKKALSGLSPKEILDLAEKWRPWRSYATIALWNSLSNNSFEVEKGARHGAK